MTELVAVSRALPVQPQPVAAPLAAVADRPFASVLRGLVEAQLARTDRTTAALQAPAPVAPPSATVSAVVGPDGPITAGAFALWHKVIPLAA